MALEGTLKDFSLADIFQLIGLQRKTGVLRLTGSSDAVTVTFLDGQVVAADSENKRIENRLGHVLVKKGNITAEQLNRALEIQKETLQRLGFILVNNNFISRDQLREALQMQILGTIYRLFRWQDGEYHFSQESTIEYDRENVLPITAESILMEGARMIDEWPIIEKRIRSYDMVFRKKPVDQQIVVVDEEDADELDFDMGDGPAAANVADAGDQIRITAEEKATYDLVDGVRNVGEIVEMSRLSEFDTNKYLYELLTRDLIEEARKVTEKTGPARETVGQTAATEVPTALSLPLILVVAGLAAASLLTFYKNPVNAIGHEVVAELKKAISLERIARLGNGIDAWSAIHGTPPDELEDLVPAYVSDNLLQDPWGRTYSYLSKSAPVSQYIISGSDGDNNTDTDLFLARNLDEAPTEQVQAGGIELVD
ncbi:MAG: DUF4388 domain-containing protein [Acidobacteria bacterium]|nr:DUF4388 domain-containing protein [Acidobacteriota bacterium]